MNEEQQIFWDTIKYGPQRTVTEQIVASRIFGEPTPHLKKTFVNIAVKYVNRSNFMHYPYKEEMINESVLSMMKFWDRIDLNKSDNPYAFFTVLIESACIQVMSKERKQQEIKIDLAKYQNI